MTRSKMVLSALLTLGVALAGCAQPGQTVTPQESVGVPPPAVRIIATDFALQTPAAIPSGLVEVVIENRGEELHHVTFVRLEAGRTLADLREALGAAHGEIPAWARAYGGPNIAPPGGETTAILDLDPGNYVVFCLIPSADKVAHYHKGMMAPVTVVPAPGDAVVTPPAVDVEVELDDFSFRVKGDIKAGGSVIRITNVGQYTHELVLWELFGDATTMEFLSVIEDPNATAPPPGAPIGGTAPFSPGEVVYLALQLEPGRYTMTCFDVGGTPNAEPHFLHGMIHEFTVA